MYRNISCVNQSQIIPLCVRALNYYDRRLIKHGVRVAQIAEKILSECSNIKKVDLKTLYILCLFHDVGAYKTDEIDRMLEFDNNNVQNHSAYGYLFLKYCSPIGEDAKAILFHHSDYRKLSGISERIKMYAGIIHIADRLDISIINGGSPAKIFERVNSPQFDPNLVSALKRYIDKNNIVKEIKLCSTGKWLKEKENVLKMTSDEAIEYLHMIIYTIDFKSKCTVIHSVSTTFLSYYLALLEGFSKEEIEKLQVAALIHDIGKIAVPVSILEYPGKLDKAKMSVMKKHIDYTEQIMSGIIPKDISDIAIHHHEKLDGSGYPRGLTANKLSVCDRILAIADIISALCTSRSYKECYENKKAVSIINEMVKEGKLDAEIVKMATDNFDEMISQMYEKTGYVTKVYEKITKEFDEIIKAES